jgi:4-amino-4-deoxy-L-arabinose transferase-like glycosyltransferase/DNA-binding beta-propeller fold protein YncE
MYQTKIEFTNKINKGLDLLLGLAALILGVIGQILLTNGLVILSVIFFVLAIICFMAGLRKIEGPALVCLPFQPEKRGIRTFVGYICGGLSIVSAVLAFWSFSQDILEFIPWILHLLSIFLFILSVFCLGGFGKSSTRNVSPSESRWTWLEIGVLLAIFAVAIFMRLYRFDQIPFGTWYDEGVFGLEANKILSQSGYLPAFVQTMPAHFIYLIALAFKILGSSTLSIRAVSVAFGLGTIPAAYLVGKELFNRKMGLVLAFLLAVSRWDVNFSRIGLQGVSLPFFELLIVGLILRALRRQALMDYALAGISIGLGLCFYFPARLFPLIIALFFLIFWLNRPDFFKSTWRGLILLCLGVLVASVPVSQLAVFQPGEFWGRIQEASIFEGKTAQAGWEAVAQTTKDHVLMFNYQGDRNGRHNLVGEPMLDVISGTLLVLGVALSLWRIRQPASFLLLAWLFIMLAPGIFSLDFESPQSLRAIGSLPAAYLLALVPIHALWQAWDQFYDKRRSYLFVVPLILVLGGVGWMNYHTYFDLQAVSFDSWVGFSTPETITGKIMNELGDQVDYYVSDFYANTPTIQFLAPNIKDYFELQANESLPLELNGHKGAVFILDSDREPAYLEAKRDFPNATFKEHKAPDGKTVLYEVYLKPEDILAAQGITASYYPNADWQTQPALVQKENQIIGDWHNGSPLPMPFGVEWKGILYAPVYGIYQLTMHSPADVEIYLDGVKMQLQGNEEYTGEILLARGTHNFSLRTQAQEGHYELDWQPPSRAVAPIPASDFLAVPITNNGLLGLYYPNDKWQAPPALARIDPWIHFYVQNIPLPRPYTVEWSGKINILAAGHYHFGLESIDGSTLFIDEKKVVDAQTQNKYVDGEMDLSAGLHNIRLRYADLTDYSHVNLFWTPPNGKLESIPQEVLFPPQSDTEQQKPLPESAPMPASNQPQNAPAPEETGPITPAATISDVKIPDLPELDAPLLWKTGECGPSQGQFQQPHGIGLDGQGNVWVADTGNNRVVELDAAGKFVRSFGQPGEGDSQLSAPFDLVIEKNGSLVVLDSDSPQPLKRFSPAAEFINAFGADLAVYHPRGLDIDLNGNLYLADTGTSRVLRISPAGILLQQWQVVAPGYNSLQPASITNAADGSIFFLDAASGLVIKLPANNQSTGWQASTPADTLDNGHMAVGPKNNLYLTDPIQNRVVIFSVDGQPVGQIPMMNGQPTQIGNLLGIALSPEGEMVVSDGKLCQVLAFKLPDSLVK